MESGPIAGGVNAEACAAIAKKTRSRLRCRMLLFEWTPVLLLASSLLVPLRRRLQLPHPALLALAGSVLAFLPIAPEIEIDPDLALALFVAPVLLDAAFDTSPRDLKRNMLPLTSLAIVAVLITTGAVALIGWRL